MEVPNSADQNHGFRSPFSNLFTSPPLAITIGQVIYNLHLIPLATSSSFFANLRPEPTSLDLSHTSLHLSPSVDLPSAFATFISYAYLGTYTPPPAGAPGEELVHLHAAVYVLAELLGVPGLKALALGAMEATLKVNTAAELRVTCLVDAIKTVYNHTVVWRTETVEQELEASGMQGCAHTPRMKPRAVTTEQKPTGQNWTPVRNEAPPSPRDAVVETPVKHEPETPLATRTPTSSHPHRSPSTPLRDPATHEDRPTATTTTATTSTVFNPDPMRTLLATHCATHLTRLTEHSAFKALLRGTGEFSEDLVMNLKRRIPETEATPPLQEFQTSPKWMQVCKRFWGPAKWGFFLFLTFLVAVGIMGMDVACKGVNGYGEKMEAVEIVGQVNAASFTPPDVATPISSEASLVPEDPLCGNGTLDSFTDYANST
ncbi:hypothetical protein EDC01DRAFT_758379 [Geopyxis carbonaria]|nr:hypothetical protein EDC01DRAFT_758379 [Geopyxis carbonaria]